jgi:peptidoglycan endopeptidase LytF
MHKIYITAMLVFAINIAKTKANSVRDSIGVENNKGKKLIIHQTTAKETYYSIARRYNVTPKDIMNFNDNKYLQIGVIIKVPTNIPFNSDQSAVKANTTSVNTEYIVKAKDNLNAIAEKHKTTVNDIKTLNNLSNNNLSIGQVLKIPVTGENITEQKAITTEPKQNIQKQVETVSTGATNQDIHIIEYAVKAKEYLNKIAEKFGTTVEQIKTLNNLGSNNLRVGQIIKVPATKNFADETIVEENNTQKPTQPVEKVKESNGIHKVLAGETIFSIAQQYSITAYQIRKANNLEDNEIKVGQALKVPSSVIVDVQTAKDKPVEKVVEKPIEKVIEKTVEKPIEKVNNKVAEKSNQIHSVIKGETIFSIAQKYGLTAYQIREANKMGENNTLTIDQKLIIPKAPEPKSVNDLSRLNQDENPDSASIKNPKLRRDASVYGLNQEEEKGAAMWISDPDLDSSKMLVLHRTLPVGRVIKITNPMTNRTTLAKVVGKFTENESTKDIILVMTKAVADALGALDKRFYCNLTY